MHVLHAPRLLPQTALKFDTSNTLCLTAHASAFELEGCYPQGYYPQFAFTQNYTLVDHTTAASCVCVQVSPSNTIPVSPLESIPDYTRSAMLTTDDAWFKTVSQVCCFWTAVPEQSLIMFRLVSVTMPPLSCDEIVGNWRPCLSRTGEPVSEQRRFHHSVTIAALFLGHS